MPGRGGRAHTVETATRPEFTRRHRIGAVEFPKMNGEGGEGEHFRTRARVEARLRAAGFWLQNVTPDRIFAKRR